MAELDPNMMHLNYLQPVAEGDVATLQRKEATYRGSWKRRGGVGAFMMMARKWDRLEGILQTQFKYDVFGAIAAAPSGDDGTVLAEVRDLRQYLALVEAEMVSRQVVTPQPNGVSVEPYRSVIDQIAHNGHMVDDHTLKLDLTKVGTVELNRRTYEALSPAEQLAYDYRGPDLFTLKDFLSTGTWCGIRDGLTAGASSPILSHYVPFNSEQTKTIAILDRSHLTEEQLDQRPRWPVTINGKELADLPEPELQAMYVPRDNSDGDYIIRTELIEHWGYTGS